MNEVHRLMMTVDSSISSVVADKSLTGRSDAKRKSVDTNDHNLLRFDGSL